MTAAQPSAVLSARYGRAFAIAVVVVVAGWQVAGAGSQLMADRADYGSAAVQAAAWLVLTLVILAGSVRLLGNRSDPGPAWALAAVALVTSTAAGVACPAGHMLKTDWAWGSVGWVGVLVLLRRPLAELGCFLALESLATFGILVSDGLDRTDLAGFLTIMAGAAGIQLAVAVAARALNSAARQAGDLGPGASPVFRGGVSPAGSAVRCTG